MIYKRELKINITKKSDLKRNWKINSMYSIKLCYILNEDVLH